MPQMMAEAPSFEIYEADIYETLTKEVTIQQREADRFHEKPYTQLQFRSVVKVASDADPTGSEWKQYTFWVEPKSGNSKFNKVRVAMGLPPLEAGEPFDTDDMENKYLRLNLSDTKRDGTPGNRVLDYLPMKGKKGAKAQAALVPETATEDDDDVPF
jgi:hypothetical protein